MVEAAAPHRRDGRIGPRLLIRSWTSTKSLGFSPMTHRKAFALPAILVLTFAAPMAIAQTASAPTAVPVQSKADKKAADPRLDDQAIICKREETTGSRLGGSKVCHTRAQWSAQAADAREQMNRIQMTPQTR
jgi:hypothetical protein